MRIVDRELHCPVLFAYWTHDY